MSDVRIINKTMTLKQSNLTPCLPAPLYFRLGLIMRSWLLVPNKPNSQMWQIWECRFLICLSLTQLKSVEIHWYRIKSYDFLLRFIFQYFYQIWRCSWRDPPLNLHTGVTNYWHISYFSCSGSSAFCNIVKYHRRLSCTESIITESLYPDIIFIMSNLSWWHCKELLPNPHPYWIVSITTKWDACRQCDSCGA